MAIGTFPGMLQEGTHAARPAATAVGSGALYACSDHALIYQSDGTTWSTWADISGDAGGSITQAYVGKNAVGASWEAGGGSLVKAKKVTLAEARLMTDIEVHIRGSAGDGADIWLSLWDDNGSGTAPDHLLAYLAGGANNVILLDADGSGSDGRWFSLGLGRWLTAGDYWIAFTLTDGDLDIAYDTGGSDRSHGYAAGQFGLDWGFTNASWAADANTTRDYSIRANTIR